MRVIAGRFHGLNLLPVKGRNTRPTSAKVKEAMFNILTPYFRNSMCGCDLFAGTGALGIEAVSRGVQRMYLVDSNRQAQQVIRQNVDKTHAQTDFRIWSMTAQRALIQLQKEHVKLDLLLLDPPYAQHTTQKLIEQARQASILNQQALIMIETDYHLSLPPERLYQVLADKTYGQTYIQVWRFIGSREN
ncbi:16S rRNA (guanine(966)-N(2))-methyltransferase RsmD [Bombilactobacillus folatiphilus]|uniref:16S rRNA (Guanine(966)-N(2))-methyltransferase RsmD n=1 Tax=Bombilactobacillus folatiphilus TaxID=2923362 RepID=A0ABY4PAF5_9LACO|nr:16S rRNA (guanine(966)-N(2))-methyltransferase RsmD [Bombilactobacillus folatiphilus]UQS82738.1 16S rRNA (guanine(966)-N(2))-methyltransferase RsmD [Bombilactobacillus folatiphilus]